MAASDIFKKQLKEGKIVEALALALGEAIELKITTWVSSESTAEVDPYDQQELARPGHRLRTCINLIDGDIENELGNQFLNNGPYRELKQFHLEQVAASHQIIQDNIHSLQKLFEIWVKIQDSNLAVLPMEPELSEKLISLPETSAPTLEPSDLQTPEVPATPAPTLESSDIQTHEESLSSELEPVDSLSALQPPRLDALSLGTDENLDSSEFEHLNSLPAVHPPHMDALHLGTEENWGNSAQENIQPLSTSPQEVSPALEEDWGDMIQEETQHLSATPAPNLEKLDSQAEEEWDSWVIEEPDKDPFASAPTPSPEALHLETDEDWKDFAPEEFEPTPAKPEVDKTVNELEPDGSDNPELIEDWETDELEEINRIEQLERFSQPAEETDTTSATAVTETSSSVEPQPSIEITEATEVSSIEEIHQETASDQDDLFVDMIPTEEEHSSLPPTSSQLENHNNSEQGG